MRPLSVRELMKRAWRSRNAVSRLPVRGIPASRTPSGGMPDRWTPKRWKLTTGLLAPGLLALACGIVLPRPVWAKTQNEVRVTTGDHPNFGRVVLDAPGLSYTVTRDGSHLLIRFSEEPILGELPTAPRKLALRAVPGGVDLTVPPDANVHTSRMGSKVVVDVDDVAPSRAPNATGTENEPLGTAAPSDAAQVKNRGRIPWRAHAKGRFARLAPPEQTAETGEPAKVSPPAEMPATQNAVTVPGHGQADSGRLKRNGI